MLVLRPAAMSNERRDGGGLGAAFVLLIFVGAIVKFWAWIAAVLGGVLVFGLLLWLTFHLERRADARENARLAIVARADQQHAWVLAGDDRGIYSDYAPAQSIERAQFLSGLTTQARQSSAHRLSLGPQHKSEPPPPLRRCRLRCPWWLRHPRLRQPVIPGSA
jgi:hypothetical protein